MRALFYSLMGLPSTDARFTSAVVNRLLDEANKEWCEATNAEEGSATFSTAAGVESYSLATMNAEDLHQIVRVIYDGLPLSPADIRERQDFDVNTRGTPQWYWMWADKLYLHPTPDQAKSVQLFYQRIPEPMSDEDGGPKWLPTSYHNALVYHACAMAYLSAGDLNMSGIWDAKYRQRLVSYKALKASPYAESMPRMMAGEAW